MPRPSKLSFADAASGCWRLSVASLMVWVFSASMAAAQDELRTDVRAWCTEHQSSVLTELREFVSLPCVAPDREGIQKNAEFLRAALIRRGFTADLLTADGSNPAVFGELDVGAPRTIVFYAHYDGQPVDESRWSSDPWTPTLCTEARENGGVEVAWEDAPSPIPGEYRMYARASSDDKAPILALLAAIDALNAAGQKPSVNVKMFLEGEEEVGSTNLVAILEKHKAKLGGDVWILGDGPVHQTRRFQVVFGARGVIGCEMTVYGATRVLHSGHYGNYSPNPVMRLAELLTSMRAPDGGFLVAGVEEAVQPITDRERAAIADTPNTGELLMEHLGLAAPERPESRVEETILRPALNVRGIHAGNVGAKARNAIPNQATASLDFRLVPDLTPELIQELIEKHIAAQGYHILREDPDTDTRRRHTHLIKIQWGRGYPSYRASLDLPVSRAVVKTLEVGGPPLVKQPTLGGSVPMYRFHTIFDVPVLLVPIVNHDNNQHAPDENLRLQNLWDGIETYAVLLAGLGDHWR